MNTEALPMGDRAQGALWAAGDGPAGLRSMSELRARIQTLFRHVDQKTVEYERTHSVRETHGVDRFWRGRMLEWP